MKKIKLPQDLAQLGDALTHEEMQEIRIGGEQGRRKKNCVCKIYLKGVTSKSKFYAKTSVECFTECKTLCSTYDDCYNFEVEWTPPKASEPDSGSGSGSDCDCGSDDHCGSDCGSGSGCHCGSDLEKNE